MAGQIVYILTLVLLHLGSINVSNGVVIDVFMNGLLYRSFQNASLGLEHRTEYLHQCDSSGGIRNDQPFRKKSDEMSYTPNRRLQNDSVPAALEEKLQLAVVLALGEINNFVRMYFYPSTVILFNVVRCIVILTTEVYLLYMYVYIYTYIFIYINKYIYIHVFMYMNTYS
jgi:hypothetical protein